MLQVVIRKLIWDEWNVEHISRHHVVPSEVEEVKQSDPLVQEGNAGRVVIIGQTKAGRFLEVVLDPENAAGDYYVVTAHTASRKDRTLYKREKGGDEPDDATEK